MEQAKSGGIEGLGCERMDGTVVRGRWLSALQDLILEAFLSNSNKPFAHVQVNGVRPFTHC